MEGDSAQYGPRGLDVPCVQWLELLHLVATRPEGPAHLRLTAIHEREDMLTQTAMVLGHALPVQIRGTSAREVEDVRLSATMVWPIAGVSLVPLELIH